MKANELRKKSGDELRQELVELRREEFNLRMQKGVGQAPRTDRFGKVRHDIARIKTILNEMEGRKATAAGESA